MKANLAESELIARDVEERNELREYWKLRRWWFRNTFQFQQTSCCDKKFVL